MYVELLCFSLLTISVSFLEVDEDGYHLNPSTKEMFSSSQSLRKTIDQLVSEMIEVENSDLLMGKKGDIKYDILAGSSANYSIHLFGSRVMGLGLRSSDCDLFVDVGDCYKEEGQTSARCINGVTTIADSLNSHKQGFSDVRLIPKARVPLLKLVHRNTGIHVDISTRNGLGVENSILIRGYMEDRRIRFVNAAVKVWARDQGLTKSEAGPGAFSSYTILWLVLFALMRDDPQAIATTFDLKRRYRGPKLVIDGWESGHCHSVHPKMNNRKNELELLLHVFNFYSNVTLEDINGNVISPYTGTFVPKDQFRDTFSLPSEFDNYKHQVMVNRSAYLMSCSASLCIPDPVEQSNNIAKAVEDWAITKFLKSCQTMAKVMKDMSNRESDSLSSVNGFK